MNIQPLSTPAAPKLEERGTTLDAAQAAPVAAKRREPATTEAAPPSREQLDDAVRKIKDSLPASAQSLEFSVDDDSKQTIVKIIDINTKEVVRQIPSVEALEIAKSLDKAMGRLISDRV